MICRRSNVNENEKKPGWKMIMGGIALIIVLFIGIKLVFWGLEQVIPKQGDVQSVQSSQSASADRSSGAEGPSFCVHCGKELPESFEWGQFCPWCGGKMEGEG